MLSVLGLDNPEHTPKGDQGCFFFLHISIFYSLFYNMNILYSSVCLSKCRQAVCPRHR